MPYAEFSFVQSTVTNGLIVKVKLKVNPLIEATMTLLSGLLILSTVLCLTYVLFQKSFLYAAFASFALIFASSLARESFWNLLAFDTLELENGQAKLTHRLGPFRLATIDICDSKVEVISRTVFGGRRPRPEFTLQFTGNLGVHCLNFGFAEWSDASSLVETLRESLPDKNDSGSQRLDRR